MVKIVKVAKMGIFLELTDKILNMIFGNWIAVIPFK